jgi:hypothetical protein
VDTSHGLEAARAQVRAILDAVARMPQHAGSPNRRMLFLPASNSPVFAAAPMSCTRHSRLHATAKLIFQHREHARLAIREFSDGFLDAYLATIGTAATASVGAYQLEPVGIQLFERLRYSLGLRVMFFMLCGAFFTLRSSRPMLCGK